MSKLKTLSLLVITPEKLVVEDTADSVVFTAHDGELGVLPGRAPLICELGKGEVRYTKDHQTHRFSIRGGFAQVLHDHVTILTDEATPQAAA